MLVVKVVNDPELTTVCDALVVHPPASAFASILIIQFVVLSIVPVLLTNGFTVRDVVPAAAVHAAVTHRKKFIKAASVDAV